MCNIMGRKCWKRDLWIMHCKFLFRDIVSVQNNYVCSTLIIKLWTLLAVSQVLWCIFAFIFRSVSGFYCKVSLRVNLPTNIIIISCIVFMFHAWFVTCDKTGAWCKQKLITFFLSDPNANYLSSDWKNVSVIRSGMVWSARLGGINASSQVIWKTYTMSITAYLHTSVLLTPVINTEKESRQRKATITVTAGRSFFLGGGVYAVVAARLMGKVENLCTFFPSPNFYFLFLCIRDSI